MSTSRHLHVMFSKNHFSTTSCWLRTCCGFRLHDTLSAASTQMQHLFSPLSVPQSPALNGVSIIAFCNIFCRTRSLVSSPTLLRTSLRPVVVQDRVQQVRQRQQQCLKIWDGRHGTLQSIHSARCTAWEETRRGWVTAFWGWVGFPGPSSCVRYPSAWVCDY